MKKQLSVIYANVCYTLLLIIVLAFSFIHPYFSENMMSESIYDTSVRLLAFVVPGLILLIWKKADMKKALFLKPLPWCLIWRIVLLACVGYLLSMFLTGILELITKALGFNFSGLPIDIDFSLIGLALAFLSICVMAPLTEEFLFRGVMLSAYKAKGFYWALLVPALLFSLIHVYILALPYTFMLGIIMTFLVIKTKSIWAGVLYHYVNNLIGFISALIVRGGAWDVPSEVPAELAYLDPLELAITVFVFLLLFAGVAGIFFLLMRDLLLAQKRYAILRSYAVQETQEMPQEVQEAGQEAQIQKTPLFEILALVPGLIIVGVSIIMQLIQGLA